MCLNYFTWKQIWLKYSYTEFHKFANIKSILMLLLEYCILHYLFPIFSHLKFKGYLLIDWFFPRTTRVTMRPCRDLSTNKAVQRLVNPVLVEFPQEDTYGGFIPSSHTINLYIKVRPFRPTDLTWQYSAITQCCSEYHGKLGLGSPDRGRQVLPLSHCLSTDMN